MCFDSLSSRSTAGTAEIHNCFTGARDLASRHR